MIHIAQKRLQARLNRIDGEKPEFGNQKHIDFCRQVEKIFAGEYPVHELEWESVHYWRSSTETGKPKFHYTDLDDADALVDYVPCPFCGRLHCLLVPFDPAGIWYDEMIQIDKHLEEEGFECWNCGTEFIGEGRQVFVKSYPR